MFKPRQKAEMQGFDFAMNEVWEAVTIAKPPASCLPKPGNDWWLVKFADGGRLYVHETRLRAA